MRDKLRWLAVPPALALLLMFGPWRDATPRSVEGAEAVPVAADAPGASSKPGDKAKPPASVASAAVASRSVPFPNLTQVACTVAGVCLLGIAIVVALARGRRRPSAGGAMAL